MERLRRGERVLPAASYRQWVQRFGGALNLHVHFHAIVAEALFAKDGDAVQRIDLPQPSDEDVRCVPARLDVEHLGDLSSGRARHRSR